LELARAASSSTFRPATIPALQRRTLTPQPLENRVFDEFVLAAATPAPDAPDAPLLSGQSLVSLLTLSALEIVLGIDNIVFIAILVAKLPKDQQPKARQIGLALAMVMRILLLLAIGWVMKLTSTLFTLPVLEGDAAAISGKDLILLVGGLFLIGKATYEIHDKLEGPEDDPRRAGAAASAAGAAPPGATATGVIAGAGAAFTGIIVQILLLDLVFSLDSVITAVGMAQQVPVMIAAVVIAVVVMLAFAGRISDFVHRHPTVKMLALSFLILIGVMLVADAFDRHIPKGYIYFAMAFALGVETLNMRLRKVGKPVRLHQGYVDTD
jgi:predicted tellurium resistance membrane protein TerC